MLATLALSLLAGWFIVTNLQSRESTSGSPDTSSAEAGFARDMLARNTQTIHLSSLIRERSSDVEIRSLADVIASTSGRQNRQMATFMRDWGLSQRSSSQPMAWMQDASNESTRAGPDPHEGTLTSDAPMPNLTPTEVLQQLERARGSEVDALFVELMLAQHRADIEMAEAVLELSDHRAVRDLAQAIINSRAREITVMRQLLASRSD
jgi:uncharacterized protein (DUF305 family)